MRCDLHLAGGQVLIDGELVRADVCITGEKISAICGPGSKIDAKEQVSVRGLTLLPGAIDPHVHLGKDITVPKTPDDVVPETASAVNGGVTTIMPFFMSARPYEEIAAAPIELLARQSQVDFAPHFCITTEHQLENLERYASEFGVTSFKYFMNFRGDEGSYLGLPGTDDGFLYRLLCKAAAANLLICPHAENVEINRMLRDAMDRSDDRGLATWNESRPPFVEGEALSRATYLAKVAGSRLYAVHVTSEESLTAALDGRAKGAKVWVETCPHYLTHDIDSPVGPLGKVNPPLRTGRDREALWEALARGQIDTVGSDHVPRHVSAKEGGIWKASAGFPGSGTLLPILLSEGHLKRQIPLARVVDLVSANPARIFGLAAEKGRIAVGSDADLAIVDLKASQTLTAKDLHSSADYTIYEGWRVGCRVEHTLVRGHFVKRDSQLHLQEEFARQLRPSRASAIAA